MFGSSSSGRASWWSPRMWIVSPTTPSWSSVSASIVPTRYAHHWISGNYLVTKMGLRLFIFIHIHGLLTSLLLVDEFLQQSCLLIHLLLNLIDYQADHLSYYMNIWYIMSLLLVLLNLIMLIVLGVAQGRGLEHCITVPRKVSLFLVAATRRPIPWCPRCPRRWFRLCILLLLQDAYILLEFTVLLLWRFDGWFGSLLLLLLLMIILTLMFEVLLQLPLLLHLVGEELGQP